MTSKWSVLSQPEQLGLTTRECTDSLPLLLQFLKDKPNPLGQVLLGADDKPWTKRDVAVFETSVMEQADEKQIADFLAIARSAAHFWSVSKQEVVPLPHYYFKPRGKDDCPFDEDYAEAVAPYQVWRKQLSCWIHELNEPISTPYADRPRLLASLVCSAMLYGGAIGDRLIASIIRAVEQKQERTFAIGGRIHIELYLSWFGVAEAETRLWLPDALTATLWNWIEPEDVKSLLDSVRTKRGKRPPADEEIVNRLRELMEATCRRPAEQRLGGFAELQRSCRIVAHIHLRPVLAHYCDCEISSNSLKRQHLRRLFPKGELIQFRSTTSPVAGRPLSAPTPAQVPAAAGPAWVNDLLSGARSKPVARKLLEEFSRAKRRDPLARRLADFGVSLLSSSLYSGKTLRLRDLPEVLERLAISLGPFSTGKDIAKIGASDALDLYTRAIKAQPVRSRRNLIKWILEFDLFLRARVKRRDSVPKSKLPWPPPDISAVDVNLATHEEYSELLRRIDRLWDVRDSERRRRMMRLIVILSFRCGLRRNEIRNLRIAGVLIRGVAELLIWPRKGEPRKSGRARRRVPISALLSPEELRELRRWLNERVQEDKAKQDDRLLALPQLEWIPNSLFDKLNAFLRAQSRWDCDGEHGGIHTHTLRHAFSGGLFISLMHSEIEEPETLFPDLRETNTWLRRGKRIGQALYGRNQPAGKQPAFVAYLSAHADFHTTAHTYIHLFPWLTAALLEAGDAAAPGDDLVRLACRSKPGTLRDWLTEGGIHNVPVRLMRSGTNVQVECTPKGRPEVLPIPVSLCTSWVDREWESLMRLCDKTPDVLVDPSKPPVVKRAENLLSLTTSDKNPRHRMEMWTPDRADQVSRFRIACPAKPAHERNAISAKLCSRISDLHEKNPDLVHDAADIFVHHLEQRDWVRFGSKKELANANRYIAFLCALKLGPQKIGLVSGAAEKESRWTKEWKSKLAQPNLVIKPAGKSRNFGPKTSLSVRPFAGKKGGTATGYAGFRFIMTMAYIAFGSEPAGQTKAKQSKGECEICRKDDDNE